MTPSTQTKSLTYRPHSPGVGWDERGGWDVFCTCGWTSEPSPFLTVAGEEFDDHMRELGILIEEA